jgi:hypothetical protein
MSIYADIVVPQQTEIKKFAFLSQNTIVEKTLTYDTQISVFRLFNLLPIFKATKTVLLVQD